MTQQAVNVTFSTFSIYLRPIALSQVQATDILFQSSISKYWCKYSIVCKPIPQLPSFAFECQASAALVLANFKKLKFVGEHLRTESFEVCGWNKPA